MKSALDSRGNRVKCRQTMKAKPFLLASCAVLLGSALTATAQDDKKDMLEAPADVAAVPADAEKTDSGLASKVLTKGNGDLKPLAKDSVKVHYTGWTTDGKMFDSSVERGQPITFPLGGVIKGWTEGLQLMVVGEKRRFWIPADLAYGENPGGGRPGGMLVFDVELLDVEVAPEPPKTPENLEAPADSEKTESGLASKVLTAGEGETVADGDTAEMHFTIWTNDGNIVQSSVTQGQPIKARLQDLSLPGWREGVALMKKGEKRRLWIPQSLTFGEKAPQGAPEGTLIIDVDVLNIVKAQPAPEVPADVAAAPADAEKTESGIAHKVLKKGNGGDKPKATSNVEVHYSGWMTNGEMFDSSVVRGETATFGLNQVIKGWTEGVQLMEVGEKRRFWIPADLAYGETPSRPGAPSGMLVFDIELVSFK